MVSPGDGTADDGSGGSYSSTMDKKRTDNRSIDTSDLTDLLPRGRLRRVDHFSRTALLAAGKALKDAGHSPDHDTETGLIVATGFGALQTTFSFLDSYIERSDELASPTHFSNSVHNAAAAHVAICYSICGPNLTISQFDMSFFCALKTAEAWLETGKVETVLLGAADTFCDVLGYCIDQFSSHAENTDCIFGETAVFFVLKKGGTQPKHGWFKDIAMCRKGNRMRLPRGIPVIVSPSSVEVCTIDLEEWISKAKNPLVRKLFFNPVDSAADAAFAAGKDAAICCFKLGQHGNSARVTLLPAERERKSK